VIIQVQERLPAQSNPSHEQSTLKLLISGFNKKLPKKESKFTMWTLKIKLLISLPKVLRGHCLKNFRKDLDWYHQRKFDLSFPSPAWLDVPYYRVDNSKLYFKTLGKVFVRKYMYQIFRIWNRNVRIVKIKFIRFSIRLEIVILRRVLMRSNITNPKTECYLHYRGSVYCTEQEHSICYRPYPRRHVNFID